MEQAQTRLREQEEQQIPVGGVSWLFFITTAICETPFPPSLPLFLCVCTRACTNDCVHAQRVVVVA